MRAGPTAVLTHPSMTGRSSRGRGGGTPRSTASEGLAPGQPLLQPAEVVVRPADTDGEQRRAGLDQRRAGLVRVAVRRADRPLDLAGVAADVGAVLGQDLLLADEGLEIAERVPDVAVLGDQAQRLLLATATDQHRDLAGRRRVQLGPARLDAGQVVAQLVEAATRGAEVVAVLGVVLLEPARADAEDEPA